MVRRARIGLFAGEDLFNARAVGGTSLLSTFCAVRLGAACLMALLVMETATAQTPAPSHTPAHRSAPASNTGVIKSIKVEGNQRIEEGTIRSYLLVQPGDRIRPGPHRSQPEDPVRHRPVPGRAAEPRRQHVWSCRWSRTRSSIGSRSKEITSSPTTSCARRLQLRPRAVFTPALAEADRQHILDHVCQEGLL